MKLPIHATDRRTGVLYEIEKIDLEGDEVTIAFHCPDQAVGKPGQVTIAVLSCEWFPADPDVGIMSAGYGCDGDVPDCVGEAVGFYLTEHYGDEDYVDVG